MYVNIYILFVSVATLLSDQMFGAPISFVLDLCIAWSTDQFCIGSLHCLERRPRVALTGAGGRPVLLPADRYAPARYAAAADFHDSASGVAVRCLLCTVYK